MMHGSITISTIKDVAESLAYFRDTLGFDVAFEYGEPTSDVGLRSGEVSLHLIAAQSAARACSRRPRITITACATSTLPTSTAT